ncbi:MAG TPA: M14 metallopeptidase family protein, partial [Gemmatimonadaceae bacterium]|nr:M14 metallopeptidase family protein [Gemmatimonadaceae bacterium]
MFTRPLRPFAALLIAVAMAASLAVPSAAQQTQAPAQPRLTTPQQQFDHQIGADYQLPNYTKLHEYWIKLARESDRMILDTIGITEEGRPQIMAIVTSPANHRNLPRFKEISQRLARAEGLTDAQARQLAEEGRAVIWIDGGLHATEVLGAQQLTETLWQMVSGTDAETMRFLDDLVILFVHANPDGHELVADWYMREREPTRRSSGGIPRLYQKYIGHDNNRDFYLSSQNESTNMNRVLYREWYPQIMYNHHQTGPAGTVMFAPPFRDPFNYNFDPLIVTGLDIVGSAMHGRFVAENKPGTTMRSGAGYSTWWNGGLRTTAYFHNIIGLLTETIGNPTPIQIPFIARRQLPSGDYPYPIKPQQWHFRQSVDYSVTANKAVFDVASRHREQFLYNIYQMGRNAIQRGSQDTWTIWPNRLAKAEEAMGGGQGGGRGGGGGGGAGAGGAAGG